MTIGEITIPWLTLFTITGGPIAFAMFVYWAFAFGSNGKPALPVTDNVSRPIVEWVKE